MNDQDVQALFSSEINRMNGEELGNLVIWFNRTPFESILEVFRNDQKKLKELTSIVSLPWIEIGVDSNKIELLRDYSDD